MVSSAGSLTAPAQAEVCVTATVYQAGQPTTRHECRSLLDEYPAPCQGTDVQWSGYGTGVEACQPLPPV
jgi:hypothetical protein